MTVLAGHITEGQPTCCHKHLDGWHDAHATHWMQAQQFVVCDTCGCKRCPKATDCALDCTNSNEPGQKGSAYE